MAVAGTAGDQPARGSTRSRQGEVGDDPDAAGEDAPREKVK